jgi:hypothetical protein
MRYSTSSCLNPYKVFFHLHTWVSFWYKLLSQFSLQCFTCKLQLMDIVRGIFGLLEQVVVVVFSLLLGEPLVLNLAMLPFISIFHIFLHTLFFITTSIPSACTLLVGSNHAGSFMILDIITSCSGFSFFLGIFMFFLTFLFNFGVHGVFYRFHAVPS